MKRGKSNWRTVLDEKLALVREIDSQVKETDVILDRDFDVLGLKHRHEEWLDSYHQKLARIEMDLREKESQIPAIRNQTIKHEKLLEEYNLALRDTYGDRLESLHHSQQPTISSDLDQVIFEGWLVEVGRSNSRKYFKLVPASSTSPLRLYGFESDYAKTPISVVQIPRKSTVAQNSVTKDFSVSLLSLHSFSSPLHSFASQPEQYSFQLRTADLTKVFICESEDDRNDWIGAISDELRVIPNHYSL